MTDGHSAARPTAAGVVIRCHLLTFDDRADEAGPGPGSKRRCGNPRPGGPASRPSRRSGRCRRPARRSVRPSGHRARPRGASRAGAGIARPSVRPILGDRRRLDSQQGGRGDRHRGRLVASATGHGRGSRSMPSSCWRVPGRAASRIGPWPARTARSGGCDRAGGGWTGARRRGRDSPSARRSRRPPRRSRRACRGRLPTSPASGPACTRSPRNSGCPPALARWAGRSTVSQVVASCPSEQPTVIIGIRFSGRHEAGTTRDAGSRRPGRMRIRPTSRSKS